jgi:hypothetical protein
MLVELHGGSIHLLSTKGVGTVLRFFIAVERVEAALAAPVPPASLPPTTPPTSSFNRAPSAEGDTTADEPVRVLVVEV